MIALALTPSCFAPPPCIALRCGQFQLLCAPRAEAASPRDRMRLHLSCAAHLPTLLPFAPLQQTGPDQALSWCREERARIEVALERLRGARQLSLDARALPVEPPPAGIGGADWLRRRALTLRARAEARDRLRAGLALCCDGLAPRDRAEALPDGGLRLHLLFDRHEAVAALAALRRDLAPVAGWALTVTGPWPPYDFTALGEIA